MKRSISALAATVACAAVCAGPAAARTANSTATQLCAKVSASSVSSLVGYTVPAGVGTTVSEKGTKASDFISGQTLLCEFGLEKGIASLKKTVSLSFETVSRSVTGAELQKLLTEATSVAKGLKVKFSSYPGLGGQSYLMSFSEADITVESLVSANGTKLYGATVYGNVPSAKLASLVKLAEKL